MPSQIASRREYVVAKLARRKLRRTIRVLREQLLAESDPIAYYCLLADIANAQAQVNELDSQLWEWGLCGGCWDDPSSNAA